MLLKLIRNTPKGSAITGRLVINGRYFCDTLERSGYQILALCYRVQVTISPKFKRLLPLVCGVPQTRGSGGQEFRSLGVTSEQAQCATEHLNSKASEPSELLNSKASEPRSPLRTRIRFHRGSKPEHSTGCILVPVDKEKQLTDLILNAQNNHEEVILQISDYKPGSDYGYNHSCPRELQMR